jgi:flagellar biosynthesis/type III secretory pathway M-ring protein FliF/YscJ
MTTLLFILLGLNTVALAVVWVLYRKARKAQKRRRVEAPNSQYKSQYVLDLEAKDRWEAVDLGLLHEVNREEMEKVLAKLRATNVRALTPGERAFLDNMVEAERRARKSARRRRRQDEGPTPRPAPGTS